MCGGLAFPIQRIAKGEIEKWFTPGEFTEIKKKGVIETRFWDKQPILPIEDKDEVRLVAWGNRDKNVKLPQTGWAKEESVEQGKWFHLHPQEVIIPAAKGYEKGQWFDVEKGGFKGLLIEKDGVKHAYMMTKAADPEYLNKYHHDRQPVEVAG